MSQKIISLHIIIFYLRSPSTALTNYKWTIDQIVVALSEYLNFIGTNNFNLQKKDS